MRDNPALIVEVERPGAGGGAKARAQLSGLLERNVHLFLNVKERAGWDEEGARLRAIGLDDPA